MKVYETPCKRFSYRRIFIGVPFDKKIVAESDK
jgi:hypothetical protein